MLTRPALMPNKRRFKIGTGKQFEIDQFLLYISGDKDEIMILHVQESHRVEIWDEALGGDGYRKQFVVGSHRLYRPEEPVPNEPNG